MAVTNLLALLLVAFAVLASALQVAPSSPCSSFCLDSDIDDSDANLSNTSGDQIACNDDDFASLAKGQKYQRCLSCLQDSTYVSGGESDQQWYIYNLRYSFDYCIFGYPNASDVGSNPCVTSEACGPLKDALTTGIENPAEAGEFDYCGVSDGGALQGDPYDNCVQCVGASGEHVYLTNFLIALEAGCEQQPASGALLGLNDTVFSNYAIQAVNPNQILNADAASSGLSTPAIAGIAIGGFVVLLLLAGCVFIQVRKRKNRAARARRSSLSFRCMAQLSSMPPSPELSRDDRHVWEKQYVDPAAALGSNPVAGGADWETQSVRAGARKLSSITTSVPAPPQVHASPQRMSPDDYTTPTSTTSLRSNAPLLHQQQYHGSPLQNEQAMFSPGFATSTGSPYLDQHGSGWGEMRQSSRDLVGRNDSGPMGVGRPVDMTNVQTRFPPPPKRR